MESYNHGGDPSKQHPHHPPKSKAELLASAKLVADAAMSSLSHKNSEELDKGRVAGAAEDLLGAASQYGKLEEKSYGKYVDKAETYLHQYHSSHSSAGAGAGGHEQSAPAAAPHKPSSESEGSGGYGDYLKMAQGFLKK